MTLLVYNQIKKSQRKAAKKRRLKKMREDMRRLKIFVD